MITGLAGAFTANVADDSQISGKVEQQVSVKLDAGVSFVSSEEVRAAAKAEGVDAATTGKLVDHYEDAQLSALKIGFLGAALLVVASFFATSRLPSRRFDELQADTGPPVAT